MLKKTNYMVIIVAVIAFLFVYFTDLGIPFQARVVLAITLLAGIMWIFEALPLHVTGIFAAFMLGTLGGFAPKQVFNPFFDPIIALLLGGFILGVAMQKHGLDRYMALKFLNKVGNGPGTVMFGMMAITSFLSFWITNTASTLIMLPIAVSILRTNKLKPLRSSYAKALVLSIGYAATIGGVGTIIGSTPNAFSVSFLAKEGITLTFLDWMVYGVPLVVIMLPVIWIILNRMFKPEIKKINVSKFRGRITRNQKIVFMVFVITVGMWLTTTVHGLNIYVVSLIPIILFYLLGMLRTGDFMKINWEALILFGSGLSLGAAISASGLDMIIAEQLGLALVNQPLIIVLLAVAAVGIALTAVASNTAAAAIFIPIIIPFSNLFGIDMKFLVIFAAMSVSLDFILPIGTPPDTIAYASGYIRTRDMVKAGIFVTVAAILVLTGLFYLWNFFLF
jgi:sodium-dependent dicarboxylate transporter 2/3/5